MGKRKMNTEQITVRIDRDIMKELKEINQALITRSPSNMDKIVFRHGALGKYIQRLISEDIQKRKARRTDDILNKYIPQEQAE